jgi:hypothetical protein
MPDPIRPYVVKTDASSSGIGAVLEQEGDDCSIYRDSYPDTIMTCVKSVPLFLCCLAGHGRCFSFVCFGVERLLV